MKTNLANIERIIRVIIALIFLGLFATKIVTGTIGITLLVLGIVFIATSVIGFCPIYKIFNFSTKK